MDCLYASFGKVEFMSNPILGTRYQGVSDLLEASEQGHMNNNCVAWTNAVVDD
jgi:hypothetical protein